MSDDQPLQDVLAKASDQQLKAELERRALIFERPVCSKCGISEDDATWGRLIDISVIVSDSEEGFAHVTQWLCEKDLTSVLGVLMKLGFKDHRHGGINFLEDENCPGFDFMAECLTPTEYGEVIIQPTTVVTEEDSGGGGF